MVDERQMKPSQVNSFFLTSTNLGQQQLLVISPGKHYQTMAQAYVKAKAIQMDNWCKLVRAAGSHSLLFVDSSLSRLRDAYIEYVVAEPFAPSTLETYLHIWDMWNDHSISRQVNPFRSSAVVAAFLHVHSKGSLGSAVYWWKGLSWVARYAGLQ